MKKCPDQEKLSQYLDGEISLQERHSVENHLRKCEECRSRRAELKEVETPLREIYLPKKNIRKRKSGCIGEERIITYLEDNLSRGVRQEVAAHLATCPICSQAASEARAAMKTIETLRRRGMEKTPESLTQKAAARFMPRKQSYLGSIIVELKELFLPTDEEIGHQIHGEKSSILFCSEPGPDRFMSPQLFYNGVGGKLDADEIMKPCIEEPSERIFQDSPKSGPAQHAAAINPEYVRAVQAAKVEPTIEYTYKKPWMKLLVGFFPVKHGKALCIITLKDGAGLPAPDVSMHVGADSTKPFFRRTDENGVIELVVFAHGNYRLRIDYMQGMTLDIKIN